jgi:hypothetical protein
LFNISDDYQNHFSNAFKTKYNLYFQLSIIKTCWSNKNNFITEDTMETASHFGEAPWSSGECWGLTVWAMVLGHEFNSWVRLKTRWIRWITWWQNRTKIIKTAKRGESHQKKLLKNSITFYTYWLFTNIMWPAWKSMLKMWGAEVFKPFIPTDCLQT